MKHLSSVIDHLLMRKERRLEKSTLPPVLTVVTIMSYASVFFIFLVNPARKIVCSVADTFHVEIFDNSLHIRGGQVTCVVSLISLHPTTGILRYTFFGPRSDQSLRMSVTH